MCLLSGFILLVSLTTIYHLFSHHTRMIPSMQITTPIHQQLIPFHSNLIYQDNQTQIHMEQINQGAIYLPSQKKYLWRVLQYRQNDLKKKPYGT